MRLIRCNQCKLMYRFPTESEEVNSVHYERYYKRGMTSHFPPDAELKTYLANDFRGSKLDHSEKIELVSAVAGPGKKVLDFGCSWGYTLHQLRSFGFDPVGFEVSRRRAEYGRIKLGVPILDSGKILSLPPESFDVILAIHVLEHLPGLKNVFELFNRLLRRGGHAFIFGPNAGGSEARRLGVRWQPLISVDHTLALTPEFYEAALPRWGFDYRIASSPYVREVICRFFKADESPHDTNGDELLVLARKNSALPDR